MKLKGTVRDIAEANIFFSGANEWKTFQQWPPQNSTPSNLYNKWDGSLGFESGAAKLTPEDKNKRPEAFSEYISDPAHPVPYTEDVHLHRTREYMTDDQRFVDLHGSLVPRISAIGCFQLEDIDRSFTAQSSFFH